MHAALHAGLIAALALASAGGAAQSETRTHVERPPQGVQRGWLPVPAWVAYAGGGLICGGALVALVARARRRKR